MADVGEIEHMPSTSVVGTKDPDYDPDDIHQAALVDNPDKPEKLSWTTYAAIGFMGLSTVAPISCGYIVIASILTNIGLDLDDSVDTGWILSSWSITSSVSFSLAGSLSDIYGRRNVILLGELISLIGSIVAATAKTVPVVIGGSSLLGFSAGLVLVAYAAAPEIVPNKYRALGVAYIETALVVPWAVLAVLLGQLFVLHATWRWIYYVSIIYATVALVGTAIFYFPPSRPRNDYDKTRWQEFLELDFVGIILYSGGLTSFLLGISWAGTATHSWRSVSVIAPIILGGLSFIACFVYDFVVLGAKKGRHALFPRDLLARFRQYTVSLVVLFVAGMVYYSMAGLLPEATLFVFTNQPIQIGIMMLPNGFGSFLTCCIVPLFIHRTKRPKAYIVAAATVQVVFTALYVYGVAGAGAHKAAWMAFQFFGQACFSLLTLTTILNASLHVRPSELGVAVGLLGTFRSMGGSVGTTVFNTILTSAATSQVPTRIIAAALARDFTGDLKTLIPAVYDAALGVPGAFADLHGVTPAVQQATLAAFHAGYASAFQRVFYSTIPFGVVALVAACLIEDSSQYMTNHVHTRLVRDVIGSSKKKDKAEIEEKAAMP